MQDWAQVNLSPRDLSAYREGVLSGDADRARLAVSALRSRYVEAEGHGAEREITGWGMAGAYDTYENMSQVTADMKKPEYASDPAYRQRVYDKIARSRY